MSTTPDSPSARLLDLAVAGRPGPAIDYALGLLSSGLGSDRLILDVLAPAQREVGLLWQSGRWNVAQEHAATAVIDGVLGAVGLHEPVAPTRGLIVVACVEGEYHSVPARMGVERLRLDGWDVTFLGANVPPSDLASFVVGTHPDAVVLSCTFVLGLRGAARGIAALAELGLPAVVAGAGFGQTPLRATRLGASAWIGAGMDPTPILEGPLAPARQGHPPDADATHIELESADLVTQCMSDMLALIPDMASYDEHQLASTRADLAYVLSYLAVSLELDEPELFKTQLRALLRAAVHGDVRILLPLVVSVDEVRQARFLIGEAARELAARGVEHRSDVPVGVMIETPAAAMSADSLAREVAFFSIGTNDLVQYTLAVDRGNASLASRFTPLHPSVLRLIDWTLRSAAVHGLDVGVCGEMGSEPLTAFALIGLGVRQLSVAPMSVPKMKQIIRGIHTTVAAEAARAALDAGTAPAAEAILRSRLDAELSPRA